MSAPAPPEATALSSSPSDDAPPPTPPATAATAAAAAVQVPPSAAVASARAAAYDDDSLDRRTRGAITRGRKQQQPHSRPTQPLDPKLQQMLDAYALDQAAAAARTAARAARVGLPSSSHAALADTHKQVVRDGRMSYRPLTDRERMQRALAKHVGGATYEDASASTQQQQQQQPPHFDASAMLLLDSTAPLASSAAASSSVAAVKPAAAAASSVRVHLDVSPEGVVSSQIALTDPAASAAPVESTEVETAVQMDVDAEGLVALRVLVAPPQAAAVADADTADGSFRAFVELDVTPLGQVVSCIRLVSVSELERLLRLQWGEEQEELEGAEELSLVDLMEADSELTMRGGVGRVHGADEFSSLGQRGAPQRPPPSLLELLQTYVRDGLDSDPIAGLLYLMRFDWPTPLDSMQWMILLPKIATKWRERSQLRQAQAMKTAAMDRHAGHVHGVPHAASEGRFQLREASASVRSASSAILPRNVVTMDQYERKVGAGLPADYIPKGLDDILQASMTYSGGFEAVATLLEALGHRPDEIEATRCYVIVMQEYMQQQQKETPAAEAAAAPSAAGSSPLITSRTSASTRGGNASGGNIATLSSLRSQPTAAATTSPAKATPPLRTWGSGHSLISPAPAASATLASSASAAAASSISSAAVPIPAAPFPAATPHSDPQSLLPLDASAPHTKLQLVCPGLPSPLVLTLNLSRTLGDLRRVAEAASGIPADRFELAIPRPRQLLPTSSDRHTIGQLKLQNSKIQLTSK